MKLTTCPNCGKQYSKLYRYCPYHAKEITMSEQVKIEATCAACKYGRVVNTNGRTQCRLEPLMVEVWHDYWCSHFNASPEPVLCDACGGSGQYEMHNGSHDKCFACCGTGEVRDDYSGVVAHLNIADSIHELDDISHTWKRIDQTYESITHQCLVCSKIVERFAESSDLLPTFGCVKPDQEIERLSERDSWLVNKVIMLTHNNQVVDKAMLAKAAPPPDQIGYSPEGMKVRGTWFLVDGVWEEAPPPDTSEIKRLEKEIEVYLDRLAELWNIYPRDATTPNNSVTWFNEDGTAKRIEK